MKRKILDTMVVALICIVMMLIPATSIGSANGREIATIKVTEVPIGKNYTETCEVWSSSDFPSSGSYKLLADVKSSKAVGLASRTRRQTPFDTPSLLVKSVQKLTPYTKKTGDESPAFSPDGTKIVFESCTMHGVDPIFDDNVWIMDIGGNNKKRLTKSEYYEGLPSFSPDGTKIIFESAPKKLSAEVEKNIFVMNIDGSNQKLITVDETQECPSWSPNGTKKVYEKYEGGIPYRTTSNYSLKIEYGPSGEELWRKSSKWEKTETRSRTIQNSIVYTRNANIHHSWSPDGDKIVFENFYTIWLMDSDGGNLTLLSPDGAVDSYPSWSPDESKIVFISSKTKNNDTGITDIWTMDSDGGNRKQLTDDDAIEWEPSYSPDGKKIVFTSLQSGIPSIWIMDSDGRNKQQLTSEYPIEQPKWSSDSSNIVFASDGDIWMMSLNVTPAVALTPTVTPSPIQLTPTPTMPSSTLTPTSSPTPTPMPTPSPTATATKIPIPVEKGIPGFEAIFAIAGILAVTYLLRRRK